MKYLTPLHQKDKYYLALEREIRAIFYEIFIRPFIESNIQNSKKDPLIAALESGRVVYKEGAFIGKFNSEISKALMSHGATYSNYFKVWKLKDLPPILQQTIAKIQSRLDKQARNYIQALQGVDLDYIMSKADFTPQFEKTLNYIDVSFDQTVKSITIAANVTQSMRQQIARDYSENMKLYIRNFTEQQIIDLRQKVEKNAFSGLRAFNLEAMIKQTHNVTAAKAKFLARQETSLLLSKYTESRYKDAGITKYKWLTSRDVRTRHDHKLLDGKIFDFNYPPITDIKTGARNNPGCDYNCRCVAQPLIE